MQVSCITLRSITPRMHILKAEELLGDGYGVDEAIVEPHRIITQHLEAAGQDDGVEPVLNRRLGLDFNQLVRAAGETERA